MADFNSMQANLGLIPGAGPTMQVKSPAQAAAELSQQASMQLQQAQQTMSIGRPTASMFTFGQQYQQQFQAAQAQSSYGPYAANMLGSFSQPSALPSPLMMTPAHTGVFRPPMPYGSGAGGSPMSPMAVMPMMQTPFTPQLPTPSFRTPWEQEVQQRELRSDQLYSVASQMPRFGGMAAGYGLGAMAGAAVGGRFGGAAGRGAGAVLGGVASHLSGFAGGMGQMAMWPMRPGLEAHSMGLSAQRMSQDWVVGGPNLHELGRGLSRDASMSLGKSIQDLSENRGFKQETRGMFNRQDLSNILEQSGKSGLMDFDQGVGQIQDRLRQVSRTVSRFMELTNDPDVTSVIKRMGQMRTFGLSVPEIEQAASSMRTFSRAAGTTIGGLWQQGLPGAMTYQGLGLSGGAGMQYGMYSAAMARQSVASGTYSESQLAMLGGVQGVAQRNMQAQGAMMSMPMFGASVGTYGQGGWGMNGASLSSVAQGGPQNMVLGAVGNMNAALQSGGMGALAMMPLQQRQIADQAARTMSPYEQTAMRFNMASETGKFLGLSGAGGFAAGARMLYGDEVAEQMLLEASNPQYWKSQKRMIQQERDTLARQQRQEIQDAAPMLGGLFREISTTAGMGIDKFFDPASRAGSAMGRSWRDAITRPLQELADREAGVVTFDKIDPELAADLSTKEGRKAFASRQKLKAKYGKGVKASGDIQMSGQQALESFTRTGMGDEAGDLAGFALGAIPWAFGIGAGMIDAGLGMGGFDTQGMAKEGLGNIYLAYANKTGGHHKTAMQAIQARDQRMNALFEGAAGRRTYGKEAGGVYAGLEKSLGLAEGEGRWAIAAGGRSIARKAGFAGQGIGGGFLSEESIQQSMAAGIAMRTGKSQDQVLTALQAMPEDQYNALAQTGLGHAGKVGTDAEKAVIQATQERARGNVMRGSLAQTREEMESLRKRMDTRTESWGLTQDASKELNVLIGKYSTTQSAAIMVNIAGKGKGSTKKWEAVLIEEIKRNNPGISNGDAADLASKTIEDVGMGGASESLQRQMGDLANAGDRGVREFRSQISEVTAVQESEYTSSAISAIGREVKSTMGTTEQLLGMSAGDLTTLGKGKNKGIASLISKYQKSTGAQAESLKEQIMSQLVTMGEEVGSSQSTTIATGSQAEKLNASEASLSETAEKMAKAFENFNEETTSKFAAAVGIFHEEMVEKRRQKGLGAIEDL
jgi:hypothetical protein